MARAWLERNKEIFIQQAFLEYLLCIKHRGYHSELERPGLHPLEGRSRGQPASLIMGFGVLRRMCPDPVSPPCRGKCKPQVSTLEPQTHLGSHLIHPPTSGLVQDLALVLLMALSRLTESSKDART